MNRRFSSRALCGVGALSINILVARHILLSTAQTLQYTGPLFLGLWVFGWYLFRGKKIPWMLFAFLQIGFAGVLLVLRPDWPIKMLLCRPRPFVRRIEFGFQYFVAFIRTKR